MQFRLQRYTNNPSPAILIYREIKGVNKWTSKRVNKLFACIHEGIISTRIQLADMKSAPTMIQLLKN